jgi:hypothetical protein
MRVGAGRVCVKPQEGVTSLHSGTIQATTYYYSFNLKQNYIDDKLSMRLESVWCRKYTDRSVSAFGRSDEPMPSAYTRSATNLANGEDVSADISAQPGSDTPTTRPDPFITSIGRRVQLQPHLLLLYQKGRGPNGS